MVCVYLVAAVGASIALRLAADRAWLVTFALLFGPRWVLLLPLGLLVPAIAWWRDRRAAVGLALATFFILGPVMGLRIHWPAGAGSQALADRRLVVLTLNVHRNATDPAQLAKFVATANPDVMAFQEWTSQLEPAVLPEGGGWQVLRDDELLIASRFPLRRSADFHLSAWTGPGIAAGYEVETPHGPVRLVNLHLASPHHALERAIHRAPDAPVVVQANSDARLLQANAVVATANLERLAPPLIVLGDFNTPTESPNFRIPWHGLGDAFQAAGCGFGYTYYAKLVAVRIDHVLTEDRLPCARCYVGPAVGSPHRPVVAELRWRDGN